MTRLHFRMDLTLFTLFTMVAAFAAMIHSARAEPTAALGYYEDSTSTTCSNVPNCKVAFTRIPASLILANVRCAISIFGSDKTTSVLLSLVVSGNDHDTYLFDKRLRPSEPAVVKYLINETLIKVFTKDQEPVIAATFSFKGRSTLNCNIVGRIE